MLRNPFGHFEDNGRAFRITNSATPMPWVNVICNGRYGLIVSQNGGGFSWYDDAQHNVLTRWEMDLVKDCYGKFIYVSDLETGEVWSAAPAPCFVKYDHYSCTHGIGFTTFETEYKGIGIKWTLTVAPDTQAEIWLVEVTNKSGRPRTLRIASYFEWTCGVAPDVKREFHRLFFTTEHDAARHAITATKNMWDIPRKSEREHWNVPWPYHAGFAFTGMPLTDHISIADKSKFLGKYTPATHPEAMMPGARQNGDGGFGRFGDACCAMGGTLKLTAAGQPGSTVSGHATLAIGHSKEEMLATLDAHATQASAIKALDAAKASWRTKLDRTQVTSSRDEFNVLNNNWLPYQAISGRLWGRTGYYQQSGAFGFRDQLQDSHVWLPIDASKTLDQIMKHAAHQFSDGSVYHWWHELADFGNHTACSDDYLWLPLLVASYIKETGDYSALDKPAPFIDSGKPEGSMWFAKKQGKPTTGADPTKMVAATATLREHCMLSFKRAFSRISPRGLPLIGSCDWNDGLSAMGIAEKGESAWLGQFLCQQLRDWAVILEHQGDKATAADFEARREKLVTAINAHAWDGAWYSYGTKDSGEKVGSKESPAGNIHLNAQTWAILTDIAPEDRAKTAWASVKEQLLSPYGPLLLAPAYTVPDIDLGYITRYSPGSRENGGVYMHAATWALAAAAKRREPETVSAIFKSIAPPTRGQDASHYWAEPYVLPGNVDGPLSDLPGRAGWTWYTGSAAWLNKVCLEWVLGIRPTLAGLVIDPVPGAELGKVTVKRLYRGQELRVSFDAATFNPAGAAQLTINGERQSGNVITDSMLTAIVAGHPGPIEINVTWPAVTGNDGHSGQAHQVHAGNGHANGQTNGHAKGELELKNGTLASTTKGR